MGLNRLRTSSNTALNVGAINASNSTGSTGQYLESTGNGTRWTTVTASASASASASGATLSDNTTTNSTFYPTLSSATSGSYTTAVTSSTKLTFNPSTGNFSATQFTSLSDKTLKTNIRPIENSVALVQRLQGVRFDWLENNKSSLGLIAQEVEEVIPELVETDNGIKSVSYSNMIGVLIEAIKEQQNQIEELKTEISILKNK